MGTTSWHHSGIPNFEMTPRIFKKLCSPAQAYVPKLSNWTYTSGLKPKARKVKYNSECINSIGVASVNSYSSVIFAFIYYRYKFLMQLIIITDSNAAGKQYLYPWTNLKKSSIMCHSLGRSCTQGLMMKHCITRVPHQSRQSLFKVEPLRAWAYCQFKCRQYFSQCRVSPCGPLETLFNTSHQGTLMFSCFTKSWLQGQQRRRCFPQFQHECWSTWGQDSHDSTTVNICNVNKMPFQYFSSPQSHATRINPLSIRCCIPGSVP